MILIIFTAFFSCFDNAPKEKDWSKCKIDPEILEGRRDIIEPIGFVDTRDGSWVFYFTTAPGSRGKPKTKVKVVSGIVPVYECYDWAERYKNLRGQKGHKWYRVHPKKSHWLWLHPKFVFMKEKDLSK